MKKTLLALSVAALAAGLHKHITSMLTKLVRMLISMVLYVLNGKAPLTKPTM